ncbi:tyrosine-type recombinase/integrase [Azospirillum argentinense]|uniref:Site-specific integrase n=1 Tax=Azospirillum argentinense TaxID=2970906 RepID=A0A5B0KSQ7_9PROT|nr:site-specific integrase [Azospirillum argentinense]KAA1054690.1 Integrase [Azospirillum argentinense]
MANRAKLTAELVKQTPLPTSGQIIVWDTDVKGFGLRLTTGTKAFICNYRVKGRERRVTIGNATVWKVADARDEAKRLLQDVDKGVDPVAAREAEEASREQERQREHDERTKLVFSAVVAEWLKRDQADNRSAADVERLVNRELLPRWGERLVTDITKRDVVELLDAKMDAGHPVMANRILAHTRRLFNWCLERSIIATSPCANLSRPATERSRDRILTDTELAKVWTACAWDWPGGAAVRFIILTVSRRDEAFGATWAEIDFDKREWTIPAERAKNGKAHVLPLPPAAVELLTSLPTRKGFIFSMDGSVCFSSYSRARDRIEKRSAVEDWTFHDLRRTAATGMAALGTSPVVIERILNHVNAAGSTLAAVYNRYSYASEMRSALDGWADHVLSLATAPILEKI